MPGKDIGVVGYDNTHISAELPVRLTTVRFPSYEIGKKDLRDFIGYGQRRRV